MAIFTDSKSTLGAVYPAGENGASPWDRLEPLISPDQVKADHLWGIPLVSATAHPLTGMVDVYTDEMIKRRIEASLSEIEEELHIRIMPIQIQERQPFSYEDFKQFGFFRLRQRPCSSVQSLAIVSSDGTLFYDLPLQWIETGYLYQGQINILPLSPVAGSSDVSGGSAIISGPAASVFLMALSAARNIPAYWTVTYTIGFEDGKIPRIVNELIGIQTAMNILSVIAPTYQKTSSSLGIDGMSQSVGTPGPNLFQGRMKELQDKKNLIKKQLKVAFGSSIITGVI